MATDREIVLAAIKESIQMQEGPGRIRDAIWHGEHKDLVIITGPINFGAVAYAITEALAKRQQMTTTN